MTHPNDVSPAVRAILEELREELNSKFRIQLKRGAKIDAAEFQKHIQLRILPVVDAVHASLPERIRATMLELFETSLELFAAGHLGAESKTPLMLELWQSAFPKLSSVLARAPRRVSGSLSNALVFVGRQGDSIARVWLNHLESAGLMAENVDQILALGKFAAWVAGIAPYRQSALKLASSLPLPMIQELLGIEPNVGPFDVQSYLQQLDIDPWAQLPRTSQTNTVVEVMRCCRFRGFGGTLIAPPRVSRIGNQLLVTDESMVWQLVADRFGWLTLRTDIEPSELKTISKISKSSAELPIVKLDGTIRWGKSQLARPELASPTSFAFDGQTLAVTIDTSFHVFLFAKPSSR